MKIGFLTDSLSEQSAIQTILDIGALQGKTKTLMSNRFLAVPVKDD
jgi:hypothetical protein